MSDNVDETLDQVANRLEAEDGFPAHALAPNFDEVDEEEAMADDFETEDGRDAVGAFENACRNLKGYEWDSEDLDYYFNQVEIKMQQVGLKKQYSKLQALSTILPKKVTDEVKPLLRKKESDFNSDAYKKLKDKILEIFGPPENAAFERAMGRVLSDTPSSLARALVNDLCEHELEGCCCSKFIFGLWVRQLPSSVVQGISHLKFNHETFDEITKLADKSFMSIKSRHAPRLAAVSAAVPSVPPPNLKAPTNHNPDEGFHPMWHGEAMAAEGPPTEAELAAIYYQRGLAAGRGRGGRGGRGGQFQNRNFNSGNNASGGRGGRGGGNGSRPFYTKENPRYKTPRHSDLPPFHACKKHWDFGKTAKWCLEPLTCPWRNHIMPSGSA